MTNELTHWEYSFLFHTRNLGDAARTGINPLTGNAIEFPIDNGLTDDEVDAIQNVFAENGIDGPEPDGEGYAVYGSDGEYLRFQCYDLEGSAPISSIDGEAVVKQLTDSVLTIILDVARAGNLVLTSSVGDCVRIPDDSPTEILLNRWPDAESLSSVSELRRWLQETIGGRRVRVST